jgi:hypothetical protein
VEKTKLEEMLLKIKKGTYVTMMWQSDVTLKAAFKDSHDVKKVTKGVGRLGVKYANIQEIKERGSEVGGLPYGEWEKEDLLIKSHEKLQLRITKTKNKRHRPHVVYYIDGTEISAEKLQEMGIVLNSYWNKNNQESPIFNIKIENLLEIKR